MRIKRWMVAAGVTLVVAAVGGYWGFKAFAGSKTAGAPGTAASAKAGADGKDGAKKADPVLALAAVDFAAAGPATLVQSLAVAGTVDAGRQAIVRSRHAGIATAMSKRAGDRVQAGERLAKVESDELRLRIAERESTLKQTQAQLTVAESNRAQQRSLSDRGFISKAAFDNAESAYVSARSAFEAAKTNLDIARSALAETVLTAPISGVISKRSVEPGERVGNEMAVFTILDPASLEVVVPVGAERVAELKIGQKAKFQLDSGGTAVEGTLSRIIPTTGSAARTVETRFALPANTTIPAGAFLSGQLQLAQSTAPVAVPRVAVKADVNGNYVWVVRDNKAQRTRVKLKSGSDETNPLVPVAEGLTAGVTVLTLRGAEPNDGQQVSMPGAAAPVAGAAGETGAPGSTAPAAAGAGGAAASSSK
jgi:RND family efflux transporter MFP subunit